MVVHALDRAPLHALDRAPPARPRPCTPGARLRPFTPCTLLRVHPPGRLARQVFDGLRDGLAEFADLAGKRQPVDVGFPGERPILNLGQPARG